MSEDKKELPSAAEIAETIDTTRKERELAYLELEDLDGGHNTPWDGISILCENQKRLDKLLVSVLEEVVRVIQIVSSDEVELLNVHAAVLSVAHVLNEKEIISLDDLEKIRTEKSIPSLIKRGLPPTLAMQKEKKD